VSARPDAAYVNPDEAGGNVYDKYASQNPVERRLVAGFMRDFDELVAQSGARSAHEVGCGEGEMAQRMAAAGLDVRATDAFAETLAEAERRAAGIGLAIDFECKPVQELEPRLDAAELVACCEVLEHLEDPAGALERLAAIADPWLIASVQREPLWRALNLVRGSYVTALGNTPGHVNHWSKRGFRRFLGRRFEVVELRSPLPWTMALCRVR
jgi:2-polyprenyl-3-methyl-5-hydroxy-6-metoxy-1,4-benzoquinol methylase